MFGDIHFSNENNCDKNYHCDYFNYTFDKTETYNTECTSIGPLLYNWFNYNNKHDILTNLYIEENFTKEEERLTTDIEKRLTTEKYDTLSTIFPSNDISWLELMNQLLKPCLVKNKLTCPFSPNVHIHYIDIRGIDKFAIDPFNIRSIYNKFINSVLTFEKILEIRKDLIIILTTLIKKYKYILIGMMKPDGFDDMIDILSNMINQLGPFMKDIYRKQDVYKMTVVRDDVIMHRVAAELYKLKQSNKLLYQHILHFIDKMTTSLMKPTIENFNTTITKLSRKLTSNEEEFIEDNYRLIKNILYGYQNVFTVLGAYTMDAYVLARMFTQEGIENITYTGAAHTDTYVLFFKYYLKTLPILAHSKSENRCIVEPRLPQYLPANLYREFNNFR
jgi:hypothetical protein